MSKLLVASIELKFRLTMYPENPDHRFKNENFNLSSDSVTVGYNQQQRS